MDNISVQDFIKNSFCISINTEQWNQFSLTFKRYFGVVPHRFYGFADTKLTNSTVSNCTISHGAIIRMAKAMDLPYVTIFEDDAYPRHDAAEQLEKCLKIIPDDAKIVLWGHLCHDTTTEKINDNLHVLTGPIGGSQSYTIFKRAYNEYLSMYPCVADRYWPHIKTYAVCPLIFIQCNSIPSTIHKLYGYTPNGGAQNIPPLGFDPISTIDYGPYPGPYVVRFNCGLGNQLFQYAFGRGLEHKFNIEVWHKLESVVAHTNMRNFATELFTKAKVRPIRPSIADSLPVVIENQNFFERYDNYKLPDKARFEGVYQDDRYFKFIADDIRKELELPQIPLDDIQSQNKLKTIRECNNSVAVHVRRGDYLYHNWQLDMEYYKTAMDYLRKTLDNPTFFIFSEDTDFISSNFSGSDIVIFGYSKPDWYDMALIGECKHAIISNSTFSWWAAWLGKPNNNITIAPDEWGIVANGIPLHPACDNWYTVDVTNTKIIPPKDSNNKENKV